MPGEPCWRWIHFHRFFLIFRWIHLHGLNTISHMSDGRLYRRADGVLPLVLSPLPLRLLQPSLFSATQRWEATCLADLGPLASKHSWHESASANCGPAAGVPVFIEPRKNGSEVAHDIRSPLDSNGCSQRWMYWELGGLWPERSPAVGGGGGSGRLRAPLLGITPLRHSAAPWAQGLPSTYPHVSWAPAPYSCRAWSPLLAAVGGLGVLRDPPPTQLPASGTVPCS